MKNEIRVLGIDDGPFDKFKAKKTIVVATFFRGGTVLDGLLSAKVKIDGTDSTRKLIEMINKCKFRPQIQCIMLDGIAFGGFNIVDVQKLYRKTGIPVMTVIRKMPDFESIKRTLQKIKQEKKYRLIDKAGPVHKIGKIYVQLIGQSIEDAKKILKITCLRSYLPEPIRVAHIIAAGIVSGESSGGA